MLVVWFVWSPLLVSPIKDTPENSNRARSCNTSCNCCNRKGRGRISRNYRSRSYRSQGCSGSSGRGGERLIWTNVQKLAAAVEWKPCASAVQNAQLASGEVAAGNGI